MALKLFELFSHILLTLSLGFYLITNLQWYSYKLERVIFHHTRISWHIVYFLIPVFAYYLTGVYFWIFIFGSIFILHIFPLYTFGIRGLIRSSFLPQE